MPGEVFTDPRWAAKVARRAGLMVGAAMVERLFAHVEGNAEIADALRGMAEKDDG